MDLTNRDEEYIYLDPKGCDDCGDIYNKADLINHFGHGYLVCRKCIDDYHVRYLEGNKLCS